MPTRGLRVRAPLIRRALDSVLSQEGVRAVPIVVVNGPDRDPEIVAEIARDPRVTVLDVEEPGIPNALRTGRERVQTKWFSALDDDDFYLSGALRKRVEVLARRSDCDTVVTNALARDGDEDILAVQDMKRVEAAPLDALEEGNWLLPGAWMCRSERVGSWLFEGMPKALECTFLAFQFCLACKPVFLDVPTIVWHMDTPGSESKSRTYGIATLAALDRILELPLPPEARRWVRERTTRAMHGHAHRLMHEHELAQAWSWHLQSLRRPGGWRYTPFGLRLLLAALRR